LNGSLRPSDKKDDSAAPIAGRVFDGLFSERGLVSAQRPLEHDPENACPGLDPGWTPVFGKDHARTIS
jgi:hypothetical protein